MLLNAQCRNTDGASAFDKSAELKKLEDGIKLEKQEAAELNAQYWNVDGSSAFDKSAELKKLDKTRLSRRS